MKPMTSDPEAPAGVLEARARTSHDRSEAD
jgi:hypothetical protein